jgi:prophage antirepressor-like protein
VKNEKLTLFSFENSRVRTTVKDNEPWFVAADVCTVLGIQQAVRSVENFPDDKVLKVKVATTHSQKNHTGKGGAQYYLCVNEPGLYPA